MRGWKRGNGKERACLHILSRAPAPEFLVMPLYAHNTAKDR